MPRALHLARARSMREVRCHAVVRLLRCVQDHVPCVADAVHFTPAADVHTLDERRAESPQARARATAGVAVLADGTASCRVQCLCHRMSDVR